MDMGTQNFYFLLNDHPREMDSLIDLIHRRELDAFKCLAAGPWDSITLCENTSTYYISPAVYRRYNMPHQRDFVQLAHAAGKVALLHMCGHVRDILGDIRQTGCDGIHALTPPPTGNTPWADAWDALGEDFVIIGILDPSIFLLGPVADIAGALDRLMTPGIRRANFVLWAAADGIPVPRERFMAVAEWFGRNA
jgi:uroporphyrinogen-III decarboxylase